MFIIGTGSVRAIGAAEVAVQRHAEFLGGRLGDRERDAEDRVGAEAALVRRAVELDQRLVDAHLLGRVHARDGVEDLPLDVGHRLAHALAAVAGGIAVAQLDRLMRAGGGAGGDGGAAARRRSPA